DVFGNRQPAVGAVRGIDFYVLVFRTRIAGVVPAHRDISGGLVDRDARQELAVGRVVVVHLFRAAPACTAVVGVAQVNVGVVALVGCFVRIDRVDPAAMPGA